MKFLMIAPVAAVLLAGSAMAASMAWDTNNDGMISADEYKVAMQHDATFAAWDADGDGMLSADEFASANWKMFDADGDNMWNESEAGVWRDSAIRAGAEVSQ